MNITKRLYILSLLLLIASAGYAQVKIFGKVIDAEEQPIEFATVRIAGTAVGATTGLDGSYNLSVAESDTIEIIFTCIGYKEHKQKLISPSGNVNVNAKLFKTTRELEAIEVTEYKKQTGGMQTLDAGQLKVGPNASGNAVEGLLTTIAGVSSKDEMSSQYSVRGGSYDENSVYINGIEVYRPQLISSGQQEGLSIINPSLVGSIEFSTGGFSAEYGDKMSSVLDITYRQPESFEGNVAASLMGAEAAIGQSTGNFSQLHGIRYKRNTTLLSSLETKGEYDPSFFDYQTNLRLKLNDQWNISFLGNIAMNNYKFTPKTRSTSFGTSQNVKEFTVYFDGKEQDRFETYFGALELNYDVNKSTGFTLLASGFLTNELVAYDISGEYWLDEAGTNDGENSVGGEIGVGKYLEHSRNRFQAGVFTLGLKGHTSLNRHNLQYGLEYRNQQIYDRTSEWEQRDSAGYSLPNIDNKLEMIYNLTSKHDLTTNKLSWYAQDTYRLMVNAGLFTFNGGLRMSYWDFNNEFLVSPRISIGYIPEFNNSLSFRLSGGLYYQSPFYKEFREHLRSQECILLRAPVIMMEDRVRMQMRADSLRQLQLPLGQIFDQIMHLVRISDVIHQGLADLAEMMGLFEKPRRDKRSLVGLGPVYRIILRLEHIPLFLGKIQRRRVHVLFPVLNVFHHNLVRRMYRESSRGPCREGIGHTPCVHDILLSFGGRRIVHHIRMKQ